MPPSWWRGFTLPIAVALIAALLAAAALLIARDAPSPADPVQSPSAWTVDEQETPRIVSASWLADALDDPDRTISIVDLSSPARYAEEHIPGAVYGWWQDGMDPHARAYGERYFPETDPDGRANWFATLGIGPGDTVVAYDNNVNGDAARLIWMLVDSGHADAMVLDGGVASWKGAGHKVESGSPVIAEGPAEITDHGKLAVVTTEEIQSLLDASNDEAIILDIRTEEERDDTMKGVLSVGQIPGSVWLPRNDWYRDDGLVRSPDELRGMLGDAGIDPAHTVIVYGQFGIDTGLPWVVLTALGYEDVRIYDQGWVTWADGGSRSIEPLDS